MKRNFVVTVLAVFIFSTPCFAGTVGFRFTAPDRDVSFLAINFANKWFGAGSPAVEDKFLAQPVMSQQKEVAAGIHELSITFRDASGQYLTGQNKFVQPGWIWKLELIGGGGQLLVLDEKSKGKWTDNGMGGGNLVFKIEVGANGSVKLK